MYFILQGEVGILIPTHDDTTNKKKHNSKNHILDEDEENYNT